MLSAIVGDLLCLTQNESDLGEILSGTNINFYQNSLKIKQKPSVTEYQYIFVIINQAERLHFNEICIDKFQNTSQPHEST
jgi:hypothetical protein